MGFDSAGGSAEVGEGDGRDGLVGISKRQQFVCGILLFPPTSFWVALCSPRLSAAIIFGAIERHEEEEIKNG